MVTSVALSVDHIVMIGSILESVKDIESIEPMAVIASSTVCVELRKWLLADAPRESYTIGELRTFSNLKVLELDDDVFIAIQLGVDELLYGDEDGICRLYELLRNPIGRKVAQVMLEKVLVPKGEIDGSND